MGLDDKEKGPDTDNLDDVVAEDVGTAAEDQSSVNFSETETILSTFTDPKLKNIVNTINDKNNESYKDPVAGPRLSELLKKGDYIKAVTKLFNFIGVIMDKGMAGSSHDAFENTAKDIDFAGMSETELKANIGAFEKSISNASSVTRSLHLTSMLSRAKDSLSQKENNIEANDKYKLMANNLEAGDVLLVNKRKDTSFGTQALRGFEEKNPADYTHSMLISKVDGDGTVRVTHSTGHKESSPGSGVEQIRLEDYFQKHRPSDVLAMKQHSPHKENALKYAKEKIGKGYDKKVAAVHGFRGIVSTSMENKVADNDEYNCVELIAKSYKNNKKISKFSHPNQFLGINGTFEPSYMTEIV